MSTDYCHRVATQLQLIKIYHIIYHFQVDVPATGRSLVQRSPTECGVSKCDRGTSQRRPGNTRAVEP
jgi:hypothetical protein